MNSQNQVINKNGVILETAREELMDFTCPFVIPEITIDFSMDIRIKGGTDRCVLGRGSTRYRGKTKNVAVCIVELIFIPI